MWINEYPKTLWNGATKPKEFTPPPLSSLSPNKYFLQMGNASAKQALEMKKRRNIFLTGASKTVGENLASEQRNVSEKGHERVGREKRSQWKEDWKVEREVRDKVRGKKG